MDTNAKRVRNISGETIRRTIVHQKLNTEEKYEAWRKAHPRTKMPSAHAVRRAWAKANGTWNFTLPLGMKTKRVRKKRDGADEGAWQRRGTCQ